MTKRTLWMGLALVLIAAMAVNVFAGMGRGNMGRGMGPANAPGLNCNLTDEQIALIQPERERFLEATSELRQDMLTARESIREELAKPEPDLTVLAALQAAMAQFKADLMALRIEHVENIVALAPDAGVNCVRGMRGMRDGLGMPGEGRQGRGMRGNQGRFMGDCPLMAD